MWTAFSSWLLSKDTVFVVGPYKTGTSLAVTLCVAAGFSDPSRQTNPAERGYGTSIERYHTHECSILRRLNEAGRSRRDILSVITPAELYLSSWGMPIVVKDPQFVFTLPGWVAAASRRGLRAGVLFLRRSRKELLDAWGAAPFTRGLLAMGQLEAFMKGEAEQVEWCRQRDVPHLCLSLRALREMKPMEQALR